MTATAVVELRRYPVKAMAGESVDAVTLDARGFEGDRWFAVWDEDGRMATGKDSRRFRRRDAVFEYAAKQTGDGVLVSGPGGSWLVGDPALDSALSERMEAPVRVVAEGEVSHYDAAGVSIVGTASLDWCREHLDVDGDVRRLRTNIVVATDEPFIEETWTGRSVRLGETELSIVERTERCRMVDIAQDGLPPQPGWLKSLGRERELCLGIYASVLTPGRIGLGDHLAIVKDSPA